MTTTRELINHYQEVKPEATKRLQEFKDKSEDDHALFEELTFCVFAANSSAEMGMKAVDLLEPVLHTGDEEQYRQAVEGKVRFYNVRSEYTAHNHDVLSNLEYNLATQIEEHESPRQHIQDLFKGIGWKESSHFLRNTGHEGYCILDKHIRELMTDIAVFTNSDYPSTLSQYEAKENKMHAFCEKHGLDVDILDLALWSYKTGYIAK